MQYYIDKANSFLSFIPLDHWMIKVFLIVLLTTIIFYIERAIYKHLRRYTTASKNIWDDLALFAFHKPLGYFIWIQGGCFAALVAATATNVEKNVLMYVGPIRKLALILLVIWFLVRLVKCFEHYMLESPDRKGTDPTTVHIIGRILRIAIIVTGGLVTLQNFGVSISGLLAFGGIGGAALAFASQDLLANFFGGLVLYLDRPFKVGDWVRSPDRNIEGTVELIGWRLTRIRTFDKRPLYVPNAVFLKISVENPSRMTNRRIRSVIGLRYDDANKVNKVLSDVEAMLRAHPEIDTRQTLMVNFISFGASSLNFEIYTFTKTTNWVRFQAIQQDVFIKVLDIIAANNAECAFPTTTVHVPNGVQTQTLPSIGVSS